MVWLLTFCFMTGILSPQPLADDIALLDAWEAGKRVSEVAVALYGIDRCFVAAEIDDSLFSRIDGNSFAVECSTPRSELRHLRVLHRNLEGEIHLGEMICNRAIADDLAAIFRTLFDERYPIERMVLIDQYDASDEASMQANNSSCFNFRLVSGTERLSKHARGMAVDINPLYNPYIRQADGHTVIEPATATLYADRSTDFPYKIVEGDVCYTEFTRHGFTWGGHWKTRKDYQHFGK